jgi:hypothetical protein
MIFNHGVTRNDTTVRIAYEKDIRALFGCFSRLRYEFAVGDADLCSNTAGCADFDRFGIA